MFRVQKTLQYKSVSGAPPASIPESGELGHEKKYFPK